MVTFSKRATCIIVSLVPAVGGFCFGVAAYAGDRAAELSDKFNFGEWRLPLAILTGLVWSVPAIPLYYQIIRCQQESKKVESHLTPTLMMPVLMTFGFSQFFPFSGKDSPIIFYLTMGMVFAFIALGWTYVLNRRLRNNPRFG